MTCWRERVARQPPHTSAMSSNVDTGDRDVRQENILRPERIERIEVALDDIMSIFVLFGNTNVIFLI